MMNRNSEQVGNSDSAAKDDLQDQLNDSDSSCDSNEIITRIHRDCILILKLGVDENTFKQTYRLSAFPYHYKQYPLENIKDNYIIPEEKVIYDSFQTSGRKNIISRLKFMLNNNFFEINGNSHFLTFHAVIQGALAKTLLPALNLRQFYPDEFRLFISIADLLMHDKTNLTTNAPDDLFYKQQQTYGLQLSVEEKKQIIQRLHYHPMQSRQKNMASLKEKWANSASKVTEQTSPAREYIHTFITWLIANLAYLNPPSNETVSQEVLHQERLNLIERLRADQYDSISAQKDDLKRLIELRSSYRPNDGYYKRLALVPSLSRKFWYSINKPECWQNEQANKIARKLVIENILLSDEILAEMEAFMHEAGFKPTANLVAALLTDQSLPFCRTFIYSGIVDFYAFYREKGYLKITTFSHREPIKKFECQRNNAQNDLLFFKQNTQENSLRKLYNLFIKHGFFQKYGSKPDGNDFKKMLANADGRFVNWCSKDSKIHRPCAESWAQFFKRNFQGDAQPTQEHFTYSHPIFDTRPT